MSDLRAQLDALEGEVAALEGSLGNARSMAAAFSDELSGLSQTMLYSARESEGLARSIGGGLRRAFDGLVFDGMKLSDALRGVARSTVMAAYSTAMRPVQNAVGGAIAGGLNTLLSGFLPAAKGAAFSAGHVTPFASGGVVEGPTLFGHRAGLGVMGEAGPEAILPLSRGADGRLGVAARGGGRAVNVTLQIATPDAESFRRSHAQVAGELSRILALSSRNG